MKRAIDYRELPGFTLFRTHSSGAANSSGVRGHRRAVSLRAGLSPALLSNTLAFWLRFCEKYIWLVLCGSLARFGVQSEKRTRSPFIVFQA
ncbi:MAG: hypothetical protein ACLP7P_06110 [Rhodomicrobium sp.]